MQTILIPRGLRLGRLLTFGPGERREGEPALDFVERTLRDRPILRLQEPEEGERGFEEPR